MIITEIQITIQRSSSWATNYCAPNAGIIEAGRNVLWGLPTISAAAVFRLAPNLPPWQKEGVQMRLRSATSEGGRGNVAFAAVNPGRLVAKSFFGKITLYGNRKGWFLIFLSIVDKNIKFIAICI